VRELGLLGRWSELKRSPPVLGEVMLYTCIGVGAGTESVIVAMKMTVLGSYGCGAEIELGVEIGRLVSAGGARMKVGSGTSSLTSAIGTPVGNTVAEVNATMAKKMKAILSVVIEN
jgi:hypothetical protein